MGMPVTLAQVEEARRNIAPVALRTPLLRCNTDAPVELYLKLENLQPIGSFKIRGAANVMARTPREQLERGVLTASAGNMAQGVAFCARRMGIRATIVAPNTAPATKVAAVERAIGDARPLSMRGSMSSSRWAWRRWSILSSMGWRSAAE